MKPKEQDVEGGAKPASGSTFQMGKYNFFKRFFFLEVDPLVAYGFRNAAELEVRNLYHEPSCKTETLVENLLPSWEKELQTEKSGERPADLKRALLKGNVGGLVWTGILYGISQACSLAGPLLLREIVGGLQCHAFQRKMPFVDMGCEPLNKLYL